MIADSLPPPPTTEPPPGREVTQLRCRNCQFVLGAPRPAFCSSCGQDSSPKAPTVGEFIQHLGGNYVAMEGALWRSLALLLFRPGQLTLEYLAGRKRRYVQPVRLYLTISLIALLVLRVGSSMQLDDLDLDKLEKRPGAMSPGQMKGFTIIDIGPMQAGNDKEGVFFCKGLPPWACRKLGRRFDQDPKNLQREISEAPARFLSHWGTAMFLLVPIFAIWLKLVHLNRRMRYTEHLVCALHLHAFWFAMLMLGVAVSGPLRTVAFVLIPVYSQFALRRVYGGRWWTDLLRSATLVTFYGATMMAALVLVMIWTLLS